MKTTITRFLVCCILFAVSFVTSFAADKLILIGDAAPDGWALNNSVAMLNQGNDVWKLAGPPCVITIRASATFFTIC